MLNKYLDLIEKHPIRLAATIAVICGLGSVPYMVFQGIPRTNQPQEQAQIQTPVGDLDDDGDDEPFDKSKCKVYYAGVLLGANVFWFHHGSSGTYLMFTDSDQLVDRAQNRGANIWLAKSDFLNLLGNDLMQQMEPEVKEVFASRLDRANYVAVVDDSLTTRAIGAANDCVR
ncbi:hypothetical protein [Nostoc sp. JL33]|uniref:hypothetical protein n=1 Tax=Nostoc sp. JL33 TaxID=2815396 RepID=UPI0025CF54AD|nr:hypothetical protein [Nostoc sp. JL33]MBN3872291.1 hypothetical protein [Nostoc sp. JL33]